MKRFCESLREHANRIIRFEKNKILPLINKEPNHMKMLKYAIFVENIS